MLKSLATLGIVVLLSGLSPSVSAAASSAKSTSETWVEGEGETYTRIEVEVNGERQVVESSEEGRLEVEVKSEDEGETEETFVSDETPDEEENGESKPENIFVTILDFFKNLFRSLFSPKL